MKKLLNVLFVLTPGSYLSKKGETVLISVDREVKLRVPIHTLDSIVCFGNVMCSPFLLGMCGQNGVTVSFLSEHGRFLARVLGPVSGNVLLRREQYRWADDDSKRAELAQAMVSAKIANCRSVLLRAAREQKDGQSQTALSASASELSRCLLSLKQESDLERIRGKEGTSARIYFSVFDSLIIANRNQFRFAGRNRRPPLDNVNALLSFFYALLAHDVASALETVGLDPAVGFLHSDRPGRPGLALDMMEEFRPYLADRTALSLINRRQITGGDFIKTESGAVRMSDKARKVILTEYQKKKKQTIRHPFLDEKAPLGLLPFLQAMLLARYIRGDLDGYPPFFVK